MLEHLNQLFADQRLNLNLSKQMWVCQTPNPDSVQTSGSDP